MHVRLKTYTHRPVKYYILLLSGTWSAFLPPSASSRRVPSRRSEGMEESYHRSVCTDSVQSSSIYDCGQSTLLTVCGRSVGGRAPLSAGDDDAAHPAHLRPVSATGRHNGHDIGVDWSPARPKWRQQRPAPPTSRCGGPISRLIWGHCLNFSFYRPKPATCQCSNSTERIKRETATWRMLRWPLTRGHCPTPVSWTTDRTSLDPAPIRWPLSAPLHMSLLDTSQSCICRVICSLRMCSGFVSWSISEASIWNCPDIIIGNVIKLERDPRLLDVQFSLKSIKFLLSAIRRIGTQGEEYKKSKPLSVCSTVMISEIFSLASPDNRFSFVCEETFRRKKNYRIRILHLDLALYVDNRNQISQAAFPHFQTIVLISHIPRFSFPVGRLWLLLIIYQLWGCTASHRLRSFQGTRLCLPFGW